MLECRAADSATLARPAARERTGKSASGGREGVLARRKSAFQAIREFGPDTFLVLNTNLPAKKVG